MIEPTKKIIAETNDWRASLVGEAIELERDGSKIIMNAQDLADLRWLLDKVNSYLSLSAWEKL